MTELLRSNAIIITTDRTRFYIATPAHAEPVPAEGERLKLCREIERMARRRRWGWAEVLRVRAVVGELENNEQEERCNKAKS